MGAPSVGVISFLVGVLAGLFIGSVFMQRREKDIHEKTISVMERVLTPEQMEAYKRSRKKVTVDFILEDTDWDY